MCENMALQKFKAESKRLLDLMINSIYTHKEIFLRELISNASDAIDKLYYRSLTDGATGMNTSDFRIEIHPDKTNRTLTISDNGCGMTREELVQNLGTIADSGTFRFKEEHAMDQKETEIIGQFGVGFYSAFMVAKRVTVVSRAYGAEEAYQWKSEGAEGFSVSAAKRDTHGTDIILELKDDTEDEHYSEYLEQYRLTQLIKKYSSYIRYPIQMELEKSRKKEDSDEYETYTEVETINSMVPLWKRQKSELTESDYNNFYTDRFSDYEAPLRTIHTSAEGAVSYNALLFIPSHAPYDYYSKAYEKGLQLYANGVLIMDKCADLLPDYFSFVRGLVDSPDLSLNISREMLQHDRQLKVIASNIEKKIKSELLAMLKNDREKYETFFRAFGLQLKYGTYMDYGMHSELLRDLLLFHSMKQDKLITLQEYVDAMPEGQTAIYYAAGETIQRIKAMPQLDRLEEKGYDVLFLTDDVDEFALTILHTFAEKEFKSVTSGELSLETEEEKKASEEQAEASKPLLDTLREALSGKVKDVRLSSRLKNHAVCLSSDGPLSIGMEKVLNAMPVENKVKADRVLELNADHPLFAKLEALQASGDTDTLKTYADVLFTQAQLIEGILPEDPAEYSEKVLQLLR
jgi:molecular chaperone HtpG